MNAILFILSEIQEIFFPWNIRHFSTVKEKKAQRMRDIPEIIPIMTIKTDPIKEESEAIVEKNKKTDEKIEKVTRKVIKKDRDIHLLN